MAKINLRQAKDRILSKWNWENPDTSYPVILWGPPGLGKTHIVYQIVAERLINELRVELHSKKDEDGNKIEPSEEEVKEFKKKHAVLTGDVNSEFLKLIEPHCLVLRLAERPIEQLQGVIIPSLSENNNFAKFVMPENLVNLNKESWGVVFLDELDKASDSKFGAATHILENKIIGDYKLNNGWYVLAAANREEDSHLSNPVPPELRNRCANIEVEVDVDVWIDWALSNKIRKDIILFHRFNGGKWLCNYELDDSYSFPSPRSWSMLSRVCDNLKAKNEEELYEKISDEMRDFVGDRARAEFFTYRELYLKFDFMSILDGKSKIPSSRDGLSSEKLISDQCIACFAMGDLLKAEHIILEEGNENNNFKIQINKDRVKNLVTFIEDLLPEIRTIYLKQISNTRIINLILDSGVGDSIVDQIVEYLTT
jgi:hypothetical protein